MRLGPFLRMVNHELSSDRRGGWPIFSEPVSEFPGKNRQVKGTRFLNEISWDGGFVSSNNLRLFLRERFFSAFLSGGGKGTDIALSTMEERKSLFPSVGFFCLAQTRLISIYFGSLLTR